MDFDFREYDAGDGSRKICHGTEPAGTSDPDSKGNYSRLWPFLKAVPEARDEILTALEKAGCHWEGEYILEL